MGLINLWYVNFFDSETQAIFVYDQYMHKFSNYLQQIEMSSNGKSLNNNNCEVDYNTGSISIDFKRSFKINYDYSYYLLNFK
jgi:glucose-6-phosphate isomerase